MIKYKVKCCNELFIILSDSWSFGEKGLKFYQKGKVVAWFTTFDYWMTEEIKEN